MIEKNEQSEDDNSCDERVSLMSEKRKSLQDTSAKVKEEVRLCFEQLANVLRTRERQLLRQIEAIHNQQSTIVQSNLEIRRSLPSIRINLRDRQELEDSIMKFGELSSSERNSIDVRDAEPYKIEDYVEADRDHVTFVKFIKNDRDHATEIDETEKFDDSRCSPTCDSSFNASSDADAASENEITVLMRHDYSPNFEGLDDDCLLSKLSIAEAKNFSSNVKIAENELHDNSCKLELITVAETLRTNEFFLASEKTIGSNIMNFDEANEILAPNLGKNLVNPTESESSLDITEANDDASMMRKKTQDCENHPKQIQQWLRQILVETETEPTIHEIEQFAEISKSRFKEFQFPLET